MPADRRNNYAFIDAQNIHKGVLRLGWKLDWRRFRIFLRDRHGVEKAYCFMGFIPQNTGLYRAMQEWGYTIVFKPTIPGRDGVKGNCDAELVLQAMIDLEAYDRAIIVSGDGDFHCLVKHLMGRSKLDALIAPNEQRCSSLLKKLLSGEIIFLSQQRNKLERRER